MNRGRHLTGSSPDAIRASLAAATSRSANAQSSHRLGDLWQEQQDLSPGFHRSLDATVLYRLSNSRPRMLALLLPQRGVGLIVNMRSNFDFCSA